MTPIFDSIQVRKPKRNRFDLSHDVKGSLSMGKLVPNLAMECVPGDKITLGSQSLVRFAPMLAPVMHRFNVYQHYFFVPYRLLWDNWTNFITNTQVNGSLPAFPTIHTGQYTKLFDYLGVPPPTPVPGQPTVTNNISAMPFAAYQFIYNEFYRDQNNIPTPVNYKLTDGSNTVNTDLPLLRTRAWEHDYFTSALPFAQAGQQVNLPLNFQDVPVRVNRAAGQTDAFHVTSNTGNNHDDYAGTDLADNPANFITNELFADTSQLQGNATIKDLRRATRLQEWLERSARGGNRYSEFLYNFFYVKAEDSRLQRPEYITGSQSPVIISEVLNTTGTANAPQGDMAGHGVSISGGKTGGYLCKEHGVVIGIMSIMPKPSYQQGIPKMFSKTTDPFEFFFEQFENIGEQPILNKELIHGAPTDDGVFGYTPRYAEYKFMPNRVVGDFRTNLNFWHDSRIFDATNRPALNQQFIDCVPDKRIFAVTSPTVDDIYFQIVHQIDAIRPMAVYGTPQF